MNDYLEYTRLVEGVNFVVLEPPSGVGLSLRFTRAGMQASYPPEHEELDLRVYEGRAIVIRGHRSGDWVWSAEVIDKEFLLPAIARSPLGTNLTEISDWSREWCFSDAYKASRPWISGGCELRLLVASDAETEAELIGEFEREFETKKKQCALLIVRAASDPERWTLAGFDKTETFRTDPIPLDDPTDELSQELIQELMQEPPNRREIARLAAQLLGRNA